MHRPSQQPAEPNPLARLSLAKFSHTTNSINHRGPLNWCHIMGNGDLTVILERSTMTSFTPDRLLLKILRVHEILEDIDLTHFAIEAENINSQSPPSRSVFAVVVKLPCLAVKYTRGNTVRRFQIKFAMDSDFYTALAILSDMKCPFSEASVASMRKMTSSQWNSGSIESIPVAREPVYGSCMQGSSTSASVAFPTSASGPSSVTTVSSNQNPTNTKQPFDFPHHTNPPTLDKTDRDWPRPSTSIGLNRLQSMDEFLPPKRDLPFPNPAVKRTSTLVKMPATFPSASDTSNQSYQIDRDKIPRTVAESPRKPHPEPAQKRPATTSGRITVLKLPKPGNPPPKTNNEPANPQHSNIPSYPEIRPAPDATMGPPDPSNKTEERTGASHQAQMTAAITAEDLSSYMSVPTAERMTSVETWICNQLDDDGFRQLCQDMEGIWSRIAFGR
ncbi:hypothetical protein BO71DRAFT_444767 [Aspergillus ellipticus CBS 707.79]|uniref:Uncharacterized protein n=1 Tax=Aspergillus ellipticus CBS 707.79 TaxID=1448320 RepID=A0A319CWY1_9EURO|nr:hypothetical protein BO71DRAFT_444767 [Aspergillus ellipticus CBS 707.79]